MLTQTQKRQDWYKKLLMEFDLEMIAHYKYSAKCLIYFYDDVLRCVVQGSNTCRYGSLLNICLANIKFMYSINSFKCIPNSFKHIFNWKMNTRKSDFRYFKGEHSFFFWTFSNDFSISRIDKWIFMNDLRVELIYTE